MFEIEISPAMKKLAGLILAVLIGGLVVWWFWERYTAEYRLPTGAPGAVQMTLHQQKMRFPTFGLMAAQAVSKLVGANTKVIMVIPFGRYTGLFTGSKNAIQEHFWDEERAAFQKAAQEAGLNVVTVQETVEMDYFAILKKYPDAGAVITHRLPHPQNPAWDKINNPSLKLVKFGGSEEWATKFFKKGVLHLAILEREHTSEEPPNFQTDQECFDYYYKIATP